MGSPRYSIAHHSATPYIMSYKRNPKIVALLAREEAVKRAGAQLRHLAELVAWLPDRCPLLWLAAGAQLRRDWPAHAHPVTRAAVQLQLALRLAGLLSDDAAEQLARPYRALEQARQGFHEAGPSPAFTRWLYRVGESRALVTSDEQTRRKSRLRTSRAAVLAGTGVRWFAQRR
jgi:hypothetical protein